MQPAPNATNDPSTPLHRGRGFTLTEMMLVIGIIALLAVLSVPAFRAITGNRSTESAQNQISSMLARARSEAMGLQDRRGVLFYRDLESQRVGMALVYSTTPVEPFALEMIPGRDPVLLPNGVGIQFVDNHLPVGGPRTDDGYIGFNTRVEPGSADHTTVVPYSSVILFDGRGQLVTADFQFRLRFPGALPSTGDDYASELGKFLYDNPTLPPQINGGNPEFVPPRPASPGDPPLPQSKIAFVLFDAQELQTNHGDARTTATGFDTDNDVSGTAVNGAFVPEEREEEAWIDQNSIPILINRYNGTLLRAE